MYLHVYVYVCIYIRMWPKHASDMGKALNSCAYKHLFCFKALMLLLVVMHFIGLASVPAGQDVFHMIGSLVYHMWEEACYIYVITPLALFYSY